MKNIFKISALVIASFAVSSLSAQALKGNTKLSNNGVRANDGNRINNTVNNQKPQTINNNGKNTNVNVAQPDKNAGGISNPSSVNVANQSPSSARPGSTNASTQNKSSLNQAASGKIRGSKAFKTKNPGSSQKSGSTNSGQ